MRIGLIIADTEEEKSIQKRLLEGMNLNIIDSCKIPRNNDERCSLIERIMTNNSKCTVVVKSIEPLVNNVDDIISLINVMNYRKIKLVSIKENFESKTKYSTQLYKVLAGANEIKKSIDTDCTDPNASIIVGIQKMLQGIDEINNIFGFEKELSI